jgi:hypothetical protein
MLPDVQHLMELQQADREILRLNQEVAALPKRVAAIEAKLAGTKAGLDKAKAAVKATRRTYESAIQDLQGKISKYRDQSLAVKTNEQYKALLHEIQFAEQDIKSNEDKILELMLNAEARDKDVKAAELELKAEMAEIEKEKTAARERTAEDEKLLAEWNAKRDTARGGVNEDLLRQYERVSKFRGSGLAEVRDQKCMGCQVMLRPQTYNEVRSGQVIVCESCQRVLYFDPATGVAVERPSLTAKRRARPKTHVDKAWFYRADYNDLGEVFFAFLNSDGNARKKNRRHPISARRFQRSIRGRYQIRSAAAHHPRCGATRRVGGRVTHDRTRRAARRPEKSSERPSDRTRTVAAPRGQLTKIFVWGGHSCPPPLTLILSFDSDSVF